MTGSYTDRLTCPIPTCDWFHGFSMKISLADRGDHIRQGVEVALAHHFMEHSPATWLRAVEEWRSRTDEARRKLDRQDRHWRRQVAAREATLGQIRHEHRQVRLDGDLPSGRCACGNAWPCHTQLVLSLHDEMAEQPCQCDQSCPESAESPPGPWPPNTDGRVMALQAAARELGGGNRAIRLDGTAAARVATLFNTLASEYETRSIAARPVAYPREVMVAGLDAAAAAAQAFLDKAEPPPVDGGAEDRQDGAHGN